HIHEHTDFQGATLCIDVVNLFDRHNSAISRAKYIIGAIRCHTRWIAEKLQYEQRQQPEYNRCPRRPERDQNGNNTNTRQGWPACARDDRMWVRWFMHKFI